MCGLTGWVSYSRDLTQQAELASAMTETMECRGPDARGIWMSPRAILGHRRLAVIDIEGGKQPMPVTGRDDGLPVITYTGEVYNYQELKEELIGLGHEFRTNSDTEVVLHAYLEWGEEFAQRLNGMYAFAIWDPRTEELLLVRDRMGVKPLFYYPTPDGVLFGSEPKAILAHPEAQAVVNAEGLAEIFAILKTPGHAVFRGMHEVVPATVVRFGRQGHSAREYWKLEARPHTDDLDTTVARIRELLEDIVERQLFADVKVGTLLSGGLDSSVVTALAAKILSKHGVKQPIDAFSIDFKGHKERFKADTLWGDPDIPFAIEVAEHIGADHVNHVIVELRNGDILEPEVRDHVLRAQDLPVSTGDMEHSLYLLCKALKEQVTVALSGEASDEIFAGYTWFHDPEAVAGDTFPWHHPWSKLGGMDTLNEIGLWDRLGLTEYVKKRYNEALDEVPRLEGETGHEARMREISYLNISRWENFLLDRKDRLSMAASLEVRVPFTDHRLVEYVFNTPWAMKNYDGREKSLLRAATADLLPESVLERKKASYPSTQDEVYVRALREKVQDLLADGAPVQQIVPREAIQKLLDKPLESYRVRAGLWGVRAVMERLVEFNAWVTEYNVRVEL
ncbi:asparagine synthase (glutamine-hydrolyzing) [Streptomyces sp. NPDC004647]|uniref:asparagine synthase (glutamine-hydrolyzing) n=1 Tax=Streptomyces sp. NPDC004647 TaxID=3154671 RepID=UPI0033B50B9F